MSIVRDYLMPWVVVAAVAGLFLIEPLVLNLLGVMP